MFVGNAHLCFLVLYDFAARHAEYFRHARFFLASLTLLRSIFLFQYGLLHFGQ
jgi:hypothetical protein